MVTRWLTMLVNQRYTRCAVIKVTVLLMKPNPIGNRVLELIGDAARAELGALVTVELQAREVLYEPGMPALHVYFPVTAAVSLVSTMENGESAEVALIGHEGLIGLAGILSTLESPTSAVVQIPGTALRARTADVKAARARHPRVRQALDAYTEACLIQMAQTAACNRLHCLEARLARSLLSIHERIEGDRFVLSQEALATMLGVHRPTIAVALQRLQEQAAIARQGRALVIANVATLEALACECHQVLAREFARLLSVTGLTPLPVAVPLTDSLREDGTTTTAALEGLREIAGRLLVASIREQEAREQAEAAKQTIESFLAMVSHELRTPLNAIIGWCAMLKVNKGEHYDRGLAVIERNAQSQLRIVEDLIDAARVTAATLRIKPTEIDIASLGEEAVAAVRPTAQAKGIAIQLTTTDALPPMVGDPDRLRQVLLNLLTNAVKFTDAGGSVDVAVRSGDGRVQVVVHDTGRGIPPEVLPRVFDRFQQAAPAESRHHGLGLGLTIARALVELHGGHIEVASAGEHSGTTCTVDLPVVLDGWDAPLA
jgi:signal transduction histidine kinase